MMPDDITQHLLITASLRGDKYGYEQFTLDYGLPLTGAPLPTRVRRGQLRQCFHNAWKLMSHGEARYVYMEGFAQAHIDVGFVVHHAWVWDLEQGVVIDNTWSQLQDFTPEHAAYFGVPIRPEIVNRGALINKCAGLFFDWQSEQAGWLLRLEPDVFFHPLTCPYTGGPHDSAKDPRQLRRRRSRHHQIAR